MLKLVAFTSEWLKICLEKNSVPSLRCSGLPLVLEHLCQHRSLTGKSGPEFIYGLFIGLDFLIVKAFPIVNQITGLYWGIQQYFTVVYCLIENVISVLWF